MHIKQKKSTITYIVWIAAMVTIVIMAGSRAYLFFENYFAGDFLIPEALKGTGIRLISAGIFLAAAAVLFFLGSGVASFFGRRLSIREGAANGLKTVSVVLLIIAGGAYRVMFLANSTGGITGDLTLFQAAGITQSGVPAAFLGSSHGAIYVYVRLLSAFMLFLGNDILASAALQFIFEIACILLVFGIGRRFFGFTAGFTAAAFLSFSHIFILKLFEATPGCMVAFLLLLGLYLISTFYTMENYGGKILYGIFIGLLVGLGIYLDAYVLMVMPAWILAFYYEISMEERELEDEISPILPYIMLFAGIILGLVAGGLADSLLSGTPFGEVADTWFFVNYGAPLPHLPSLSPDYFTQLECLIYGGLALWTVIGFFKRETCDRTLPWILMLGVAPMPLMLAGYLRDNTGSLVIFALLAGVGVWDMLYIPPAKAEAANETEEESDVENETDDESAVENETDDESAAEDETKEKSAAEDETDDESAIENGTEDEPAVENETDDESAAEDETKEKSAAGDETDDESAVEDGTEDEPAVEDETDEKSDAVEETKDEPDAEDKTDEESDVVDKTDEEAEQQSEMLESKPDPEEETVENSGAEEVPKQPDNETEAEEHSGRSDTENKLDKTPDKPGNDEADENKSTENTKDPKNAEVVAAAADIETKKIDNKSIEQSRTEELADNTEENSVDINTLEADESEISASTNDKGEADKFDGETPTPAPSGIIKKPERQVRFEAQVDEKPGMIPNPLPLPARRVRAQLDYAYEVSEDKMNYDTDIDDSDDFDI